MSITTNDIIVQARKYIGVPYLYGGCSPNGFDCSGLCHYVYKELGVKIGRTTYEQIKDGVLIDKKEDLQEGDLIFNFTNNSPTHVFIYSGNGNVIEAKKTGTLISEHNKWRWEGTARRIINNKNQGSDFMSNEVIGHRGGHSSKARGASKHLDEYDQMQGLYRQMDYLFNEYGNRTVDCNSHANSENKEIREGASKANNANVGLFLSYHMNAGGGTGVEVWVHSRGCRAEARARKVCENLSKLGFPNRGVKYNSDRKDNLYEMSGVNAPNMIIECCFVDSKADADLWNSLSWDDISYAIGNAINGNIPFKKPVSENIPSDNNSNSNASIEYQAHIENIGWQDVKRNGETAGTTGEWKKMEALSVTLKNSDAILEIQGHVADIGWQSVRGNGEIVGSVGMDRRLEAVCIKANGLNITYRVHVAEHGWLDWVSNGEMAGTVGEFRRIEAIEIKIV